MKNNATYGTIKMTALVIVIGLLLAIFTTSVHVYELGIDNLDKKVQLDRHQDIINGHAGNPWQYRVLAPYMINVVIKVFRHLNIPHYVAISFILFRFIQDTFVLLLSFAYYRKLGLSWSNALIGMIFMAWGMSYSHYASDLQFNTFFDIIFYFLAGLCILQQKYIWIIPITLLAAFNRETSGLIPLLLFFSIAMLQKESIRKVLPIFITAVVVYIVVFVGLRYYYGYQELILPYDIYPGLDLLRYNLFRPITWLNLIATLSVIPILAIIGYQKWTRQLQIFFWVIVPIWFLVHAFGAVMAETRLLLVPQGMVFIPGALFYLAQVTYPPKSTT